MLYGLPVLFVWETCGINSRVVVPSISTLTVSDKSTFMKTWGLVPTNKGYNLHSIYHSNCLQASYGRPVILHLNVASWLALKYTATIRPLYSSPVTFVKHVICKAVGIVNSWI